MMLILTIVFVGLFFYFDLELHKKRSRELVALYFSLSRLEVWAWSLWMLWAVWQEASTAIVLVEIALLGLAIAYTRCRHKLILAAQVLYPECDDDLNLALSTYNVLLGWILVVNALTLFLDLLVHLLHLDWDRLAMMLIVTELNNIILLVFIYLAVRKYPNLKLMRILGLEIQGLKIWKIWVLPAFCGLAFALIAVLFLNARRYQPMTPMQELVNSTSSWQVILFFVGTAILSAPFFEEIIFRGFFFYIFERFKGAFWAVIAVALVFCVLHIGEYWGDWTGIVIIGFFSLFVTILRAWSGSAVPGMVAHYVYNASIIIFPLIVLIFVNPQYLDYELKSWKMTDQQREEYLLKTTEENPKFSEAFNDLAWEYSQKGKNLNKALELIDRALTSKPQETAYLDTKAEILFRLNRRQEALLIEKRLLAQNPHDPYLIQQIKKFEQAPVPANP